MLLANIKQYKTYKKKLTKILKLSQHQYYLDSFENSKNNIQHIPGVAGEK